ncbi:hypothetical protein VTN77DRAFT_2831 [Rasamsonia byssochlamydoides]|uniref:uncharacterized protein n=1 Tax=Rasamsonia byssochlamydoides TaxID=89139 RepID=UPI0037436AF7
MAVLCDEKAANRAVSKVIPVLLLGIIVYASYAVTKPLCIDYLIHPSPSYHRSPRVGAGAVIIALYYVLLCIILATYLRLYHKVIFNPDYLPRGQCESDQNEAGGSDGRRKSRRTQTRRTQTGRPRDDQREKNDLNSSADVEGARDQIGGKAFPLDPAGLESFYMKEVFVCQEDGRPPYCSKCCQFKTDRAHHCREVDRCVRRMDHFCPWVGGVVSESSHKFFIQYVFYTAIFCGFNIIVLAIFTAELRREAGRVNAHWLVTLGLGCLFFIFSAGMTGTSLHLAGTNTTTIENITRKTKVWTLAIRINRPKDAGQQRETEWAQVFRTITYPSRPSLDSSDQDFKPEEDSRVFAILQTQPGENPFDLGSPLKNLQQVMGYTVWDWLLPLKPSPCVDHSSPESTYAMGPVVQRLKHEAGLTNSAETSENRKSDRRHHRHHRRHHRNHHRSRSHHHPRESDASARSGPSEHDDQPQQPARPDREDDSNQ